MNPFAVIITLMSAVCLGLLGYMLYKDRSGGVCKVDVFIVFVALFIALIGFCLGGGFMKWGLTI